MQGLLHCLSCALFFSDITLCSSSSNNGLEISSCPTWTYPHPHHNYTCICGKGIITCDPDTLTVSIVMRYVCMFFSEELQTTLVGTCPYGYPGKVPRNPSQIMEASARLCFYLHRTGPLCGECEDNYTLPAYSYYLGCVRCESYKNGWIKFIAAAFLPLTLFYMVVIAFRISVTSPTLNAFVMANQVLAIPRMVRRVYSNNLMIDPYRVSYLGQISVDFMIAVVAIWNLDFFRSFYLPICLHPYLKYQHVLLLEYIIGIDLPTAPYISCLHHGQTS